METFVVTLVVWLSFANPDFGDGFREARMPGLTEEACKAAAKLVQRPQGSAWCVVEGRPEPVWTKRSPGIERAPICANCGAIPGRRPV
jgi:hypothetical protein